MFIDLFCGGGGASSGVLAAYAEQNRNPVGVFVDYDPVALRVHSDNHPGHVHLEEDLFKLNPADLKAADGEWAIVRKTDEVSLLWASPSCVQFSLARGNMPVTEKDRAHGDVAIKWIREFRPRAVICENVVQWQQWGPLTGEPGNMRPDPARKGEYFREWIQALEELGYDVEYRELCSADYGNATIRRRLFVMACRRDTGLTIQWPEPLTPEEKWVRALDVLELNDIGKPIFERKKGLAPKTLRRIARGLMRQIASGTRDDLRYLVILRSGSSFQLLDRPMPTSTTSGGHQMVVTVPFLVNTNHGQDAGCVSPINRPLKTLTTKSSWGTFMCPLDPLPRGMGMVELKDAPPGLARDFAVILQQELDARPVRGVGRVGMKKTDEGAWRPALVVEDGLWVLNPHFRMVNSRELATAQGFPRDYVWNCTGTQKTKIIGNSVSGGVARALAASFLKQKASNP